MQIVQYQTEAEAQTIITTKTSQGLVLIEVQNITEGNFLGFRDATPDELAYINLSPLDKAKGNKITELKNAQTNALLTFKSSALGTEHTYLSGDRDMMYLNGEYSYIKSDDYQGESPTWYTVEESNVTHTKTQFVQVYLDGRAHVQSMSYHRATLEAQVNAIVVSDTVTEAQSVDAVNAIVW